MFLALWLVLREFSSNARFIPPHKPFINFLAQIPILPVGLYVNVLTSVITLICYQVPFARKFVFFLSLFLFKILQKHELRLAKVFDKNRRTKFWLRDENFARLKLC